MFKCCLVAASTAGFIFFGNAVCAAQQPGSPEALRSANALFSLISNDVFQQMSEGATAQVWPQIQASIPANIDAATRVEPKDQFDRILQRFLARAVEEAPVFYARYFSAQELDEIAAFYRTPIGKKMLRLQPKINAELLVPRMPELRREIRAAIRDTLREHGYR